MKDVSIIGVCKCLEAVFAIAEVEQEEDKDFSFSREHWQSGEKNRERGSAWLDQIYQQNRAGTINALAAHRDFGMSRFCYLEVSFIFDDRYRSRHSLGMDLIYAHPPQSQVDADIFLNRATHSLDLHGNHVRSLSLRSQHSRRHRYRARGLVRNYDPKLEARDRLASARDTARGSKQRRRRKRTSMRELPRSRPMFLVLERQQ